MAEIGARSPDGRWAWDGQTWQPVGPPPPPPVQPGYWTGRRTVAAVALVVGLLLVGIVVLATIRGHQLRTSAVPGAPTDAPRGTGAPMAVDLTFSGAVNGSMSSATVDNKRCGVDPYSGFFRMALVGSAAGETYLLDMSLQGYHGPGQYLWNAHAIQAYVDLSKASGGRSLFRIVTGSVTVNPGGTSGRIDATDMESDSDQGPTRRISLVGTWSCPA